MFTRNITVAAHTTGLALAGIAVVLFVSGGLLHAQTADGEVVIYQECRRPPERLQWGRFPECGIDEEATRALREELEETTRSLTPQEQEQVEKRIEEQFVAPALAGKQVELMDLLDWTVRRIEAVLENEAYQFSDADRTALQQAKTTLRLRLTAVGDKSLTRDELDDLTAAVRGIVTDVSRIVAAAPKVIPPETPAIESLVTRIDALVARVGTVIRDLEREGLTVPRAVRDGHAHALELVRESKQTCSTRRPASCAKLGEVLDTVEAMREPLCKLKSDFLAQICD